MNPVNKPVHSKTNSLDIIERPIIDFWENDLDPLVDLESAVKQLEAWIETGSVSEAAKPIAALLGGDKAYLHVRALIVLKDYLEKQSGAVNVDHLYQLKDLIEPILTSALEYLSGKNNPNNDMKRQLPPAEYHLHVLIHQAVGRVRSFFIAQGTTHHPKLWKREFNKWFITIWTDAGLKKKLIKHLK